MNRRGMLLSSAYLAAAAALGGCGTTDATAPTTLTPLTLSLADYPSLAEVGGVALVTADGSPIAVVRTGESSFLALARRCPHEGATVGVSTTGFECPRHHARFSSDGTWTGGQRTSSLRQYPATYNASTNTVSIG